MIILHRTRSVVSTNLGKALVHAHEVAAYLKEKTKKDVTVQMPVGGTWCQIRWSIQFADLADYDKWTAAFVTDRYYMDLLSSSHDLFIEGSATDEIWRVMDRKP